MRKVVDKISVVANGQEAGGARCCAPTVDTQQRCAAAALNAETAQRIRGHAGRYAAQGHLYTPGKIHYKRLYDDLYSRRGGALADGCGRRRYADYKIGPRRRRQASPVVPPPQPTQKTPT